MQSTGKIEGETFNLFQAIIEQAPDAMIYADRSGTIRIWNRGAEAIFGYAAERSPRQKSRCDHSGAIPASALGWL
jgi:PAS domain-containing protein